MLLLIALLTVITKTTSTGSDTHKPVACFEDELINSYFKADASPVPPELQGQCIRIGHQNNVSPLRWGELRHISGTHECNRDCQIRLAVYGTPNLSKASSLALFFGIEEKESKDIFLTNLAIKFFVNDDDCTMLTLRRRFLDVYDYKRLDNEDQKVKMDLDSPMMQKFHVVLMNMTKGVGLDAKIYLVQQGWDLIRDLGKNIWEGEISKETHQVRFYTNGENRAEILLGCSHECDYHVLKIDAKKRVGDSHVLLDLDEAEPHFGLTLSFSSETDGCSLLLETEDAKVFYEIVFSQARLDLFVADALAKTERGVHGTFLVNDLRHEYFNGTIKFEPIALYVAMQKSEIILTLFERHGNATNPTDTTNHILLSLPKDKIVHGIKKVTFRSLSPNGQRNTDRPIPKHANVIVAGPTSSATPSKNQFFLALGCNPYNWESDWWRTTISSLAETKFGEASCETQSYKVAGKM